MVVVDVFERNNATECFATRKVKEEMWVIQADPLGVEVLRGGRGR